MEAGRANARVWWTSTEHVKEPVTTNDAGWGEFRVQRRVGLGSGSRSSRRPPPGAVLDWPPDARPRPKLRGARLPLRAGHRPRGARPAPHADQALLRLPQPRSATRPTRNVCPVCLGLPGALPVLNRQAVTLAMRAALATGCTVQRDARSSPARTTSIPTCPRATRSRSTSEPLATDGYVEIPAADGGFRARARSSASTWRRTRASSCTRASPGRTSRAASTSTAAACP